MDPEMPSQTVAVEDVQPDQMEPEEDSAGKVDVPEPETSSEHAEANQMSQPEAKPTNASAGSQSTGPTSRYRPPDWASTCPPSRPYRLEVIKNGVPLPECTVELPPGSSPSSSSGLSFCLIGRQPQMGMSDGEAGQIVMTLAHPSISRVHAVLQYGQPPPTISRTSAMGSDRPGWYLQDFDSTHGTRVNKYRLRPGRFVRVHVGYVLRFGGSTRLHVLCGPDDDVQPETEQSWTSLKQEFLARRLRQQEKERSAGEWTEEKGTPAEAGCNWGMSVDDDTEAGQIGTAFLASISGAACLSYEHTYRDDPKRALNAYFEREGIDPPPQYEFVEAAFGKQHCRLELPLPIGNVTAEASVTGKRKEAVAACALEACRILDRMGELDPNKDHSTARRRNRTLAYWQENDFYSSDEDTFVDRTGQIERRRLERIRQLGLESEVGELAGSLEQKCSSKRKMGLTNEDDDDADNKTILAALTELEKVGEEIVAIEERLHAIDEKFAPKGTTPTEMDELEVFMDALKSDGSCRQERSRLRARLFTLRQTEMRLFKRSGLPQPKRQRGSLLAPVTTKVTADQVTGDGGGASGGVLTDVDVIQSLADAGASRTRPTDAAAAVRAVKRKLEETGQAVSRPQKQMNLKSTLDAIKRSLPSYSERPRVRSIEADASFEAEDDDADDEEEARDLRVEVQSHGTTNNSSSTTNTNSSAIPDLKSHSGPAKEQTDIAASEQGGPSSPKPDCPQVDGRRVIGSDTPAAVAVADISTSKSAICADYDKDTSSESTKGGGPLSQPANQSQPNSKRRHRQPPQLLASPTPQVTEDKIERLPTSHVDFTDPDYVTWVPPKDQKGDGITELNAKYGY